MPEKRYTDEQITCALRQLEAGTPVREICRKMGVTEATYYRWRKSYAGMGLAESRVRYGYRRLSILLRREGWPVDDKRIYRLYSEEGLSIRTRSPKRRRSCRYQNGRPEAAGVNEC